MSWTAINPVLIKVFTDLAAHPQRSKQGFTAEFHEGPLGYISNTQDQALYLKVSSLRTVGTTWTEYREVDGKILEDSISNINFTLQVQAHVLERTDEHWSMGVLSRVRSGLYLSSVQEQFEAVNLGLIDVLAANKVSAFFQGRLNNIAVMDVMFSTVTCFSDPIPGGWIERIELSSDISPTDANWDDELMPA